MFAFRFNGFLLPSIRRVCGNGGRKGEAANHNFVSSEGCGVAQDAAVIARADFDMDLGSRSIDWQQVEEGWGAWQSSHRQQ